MLHRCSTLGLLGTLRYRTCLCCTCALLALYWGFVGVVLVLYWQCVVPVQAACCTRSSSIDKNSDHIRPTSGHSLTRGQLRSISPELWQSSRRFCAKARNTLVEDGPSLRLKVAHRLADVTPNLVEIGATLAEVAKLSRPHFATVATHFDREKVPTPADSAARCLTNLVWNRPDRGG